MSLKSLDDVFSFKRYFINSLDSYHGQYFLQKISKILEQPLVSSVTSAQSVVGEHLEQEPIALPVEHPYEIIGSVTDPKIKALENVSRVVPLKECLPQMLTCGTVVLDISRDKEELKLASDYLKLLKDFLEKQKPVIDRALLEAGDSGGDVKDDKRYLLLISTVMTWGLTKPLDPDTPDMPFIETDFRKRKPHPNYKQHYDIENEVIGIARKYKSQIRALVVASGLTYGGAEEALFYWFQKAWEYEHILPIIGRGSNVVPLVNIMDLAEIVYNLIMSFPKKLYILAVEQNIIKQREIIKPLGRMVGTGMFKCIPIEDAYLIPEIDQRTYDLISLNIYMEPTYIVETMALQWTFETPFPENVPALMKQFKKERGLKPFKILVYGPPLSGKTTLAKLICENYGLVYISPETVAEDLLEDLEWRIKHWNEGETAALNIEHEEDQNINDDNEDEAEDENTKESARVTLAMLRSGRPLSEQEILGYVRQRLLSHEALNKGWVLDGFPRNLDQCTALFEKGEEQDTESIEENENDMFEEDMDLYSNVLRKLLPDVVVYLDATDDFICEKAMRQPETGESRLEEEAVLKRLSLFRTADAHDVTPLNFFDELDIHPLVIPVTDHDDYSMKTTYSAVSLRMGRPCRYGKLIELIDAAEKKKKLEQAIQDAKEVKTLEKMKKKLKEEREEKMEYWSELYALMREEEEAALAAAGESMRNYLVHYIFPTLTNALLEVAKLRPDDPIDFLAEYLFKLNPTGKMLEPGYNLQAEKILGKIKILDDALQDLDIKIDPLVTPEVDLDQGEASTSKKNINTMSAF